MTDYKAEQADELEALEAIYMEQYEIIDESVPKYQIKLEPVPDGGDGENFVALYLKWVYPETYPDVLPEIELEGIKGLDDDQLDEIKAKALEEAETCMGMAMIFTMAEVAKEWLEANNKPKEESMHQQMIARMEENKAADESVVVADAEEEEEDDFQRARKKKDGKPVTKESFETWFKQYIIETKEQQVENTKQTGRELFESSKLKESDTPMTEEEEAAIGAENEALFLDDNLDDLDDLDDLEE